MFLIVKIALMRGEARPLRCRIVSDPTINGAHVICFSYRLIRGIFVAEVLRKRAELSDKMETTIMGATELYKEASKACLWEGCLLVMKCCESDNPAIVKRLIRYRNVLLCIAYYPGRARFGFSGPIRGHLHFYEIYYNIPGSQVGEARTGHSLIATRGEGLTQK